MIYQLSLTFQKDREIYTPTKKKRMYVAVYCGSALYSVILKCVVEGLSQFQLNLHLLLLYIKREKF